MESLNVSLIIEQLKDALNERTDKSLCEKLGITPQTLSSWKRRNSIPYETIVEIAHAHNLSLDWLTFGKESQSLTAIEQMMLTAFNQLDDKQRLQAVVFVGNLAQGGGANGQGGNTITANNSRANNIANGNIAIGR